MIEIYRPKWEGNEGRRIGLAEYRLKYEGAVVEINITYKNKEGLRLYPDPFYMRKVDIVKYPVEMASGTKVYVIPIADLSPTSDCSTQYVPYEIHCCGKSMRQKLNGIRVTYHCNKCGKQSPIEWEIEKVATETPKGLEKDTDIPVISNQATQPNLGLQEEIGGK